MTRATLCSVTKLPRRFPSHLGVTGARYRQHFQALEAQLGPFTTELVRQAAADAAQCHVIKLSAVEAWQEAQERRTTGKGRRPNTGEIIRLAKRVALESSSYTLAFNRLQDLLGTPKRSAHEDLLRQFRPGMPA
jgi:hypothetical protein